MSEPEVRPKAWRRLVESGFEPRPYRWEDLPLGQRRVRLEASCWHPEITGVICFFQDLDSEQQYRITVFRNRKTERYGPEGCDFSDVRPGTVLTIDISRTSSGQFKIQGAHLS
jgi:hypothetical protein